MKRYHVTKLFVAVILSAIFASPVFAFDFIQSKDESYSQEMTTGDLPPDVQDFQEATTGPLIEPDETVKIEGSEAPFEITKEKRLELEEATRHTHLPTVTIKKSNEPLAPPDGARQTGTPKPRTNEPASQIDPKVPGTVTIWRNRTIVPPAGFSSDINEPSVAANGRYAFYTGNWYAARTANAGATWVNIDPFADMGGLQGDFCCDQDVIFDKSRNMMIWYRQGLKNRQANGTNRIRLGRSLDGGVTWVFYDILPTSVNGAWTNQWFDYPHIALSTNYLYFTSNMFNNADAYQRSVLVRISLDGLRAAAGINLPSWTQTGGTWAPVQGATDMMYIGRHETNASFRIYTQSEANVLLGSALRAIPAWDTAGVHSCPLPSGENPCARSDNRPLSGWVSHTKQEVGFFWNAPSGVGFPFPYVNSAVFFKGSLNAKYRPFIFNGGFAWHYAAASPNARGDVGIAAFSMGGGTFPKVWVGMDDDFNGQPPGWDVVTVATSTVGPGSNTWGDYLRVRPYSPTDLGWAATGYVPIAGGISSPRYFIWSRERDTGGMALWLLQP